MWVLCPHPLILKYFLYFLIKQAFDQKAQRFLENGRLRLIYGHALCVSIGAPGGLRCGRATSSRGREW